jgi:hypothetical protein
MTPVPDPPVVWTARSPARCISQDIVEKVAAPAIHDVLALFADQSQWFFFSCLHTTF